MHVSHERVQQNSQKNITPPIQKSKLRPILCVDLPTLGTRGARVEIYTSEIVKYQPPLSENKCCKDETRCCKDYKKQTAQGIGKKVLECCKQLNCLQGSTVGSFARCVKPVLVSCYLLSDRWLVNSTSSSRNHGENKTLS